MTDRELLDLAKKAAGIDWLSRWWNPLTDDGDALRLAVKLRIGVICQGATVVTLFDKREPEIDDPVPNRRTMVVEGDELAATRRAIVLAAAQIGAQPSQGVSNDA